jgi:hypothetical protein
MNVRLVGDWAITFWRDDSVKEIRIVRNRQDGSGINKSSFILLLVNSAMRREEITGETPATAGETPAPPRARKRRTRKKKAALWRRRSTERKRDEV